MGSEIRLLIGPPSPGSESAPAAAAERAQQFVRDFEAALSRFRNDSELCAFNRDPRAVVPASGLLRAMVAAAVEAAERSAGLVDPTLLGEIEAAGYIGSQADTEVSLATALEEAPPRRPSRPRADESWRRLEVSDGTGTISRPLGVRLDSGGIGKGLAADLIAAQLRPFSRFVVDCGGDIRIGGAGALADPYDVFAEHPLTGARLGMLRLGFGGVATSGLNVRIWRGADGRCRHHLLDPSTGEPAWTGLIGATALGDTAVEAEALAKAALLSGPAGARTVLAGLGGLIIHDGGEVETVGPFSLRRL
ncbi:MAG: FAD:protein FMN transferase [Solirubrobacterales bacterium]